MNNNSKICSARKIEFILQGVLLGIVLMLPDISYSAEQCTAGDNCLGYIFTGTLKAKPATPCTINNDQIIDIPFGDVAINKVADGGYIKEIDYKLDCGDIESTDSVSMSVKATPAAGNESAVETDIPGLWVEFLKDQEPLPLNRNFNVTDLQNPPKLEVKLIKDAEQTLVADSFSATVTLMATYT